MLHDTHVIHSTLCCQVTQSHTVQWSFRNRISMAELCRCRGVFFFILFS
jgi:hypothetical protein